MINYLDKQKNHRMVLMAICLVIYMILSIGRVLPFDSEDSIKALLGGFTFFCLVYFNFNVKIDKRTLTFVSWFAFIGLIITSIGSIDSINIDYAIDKLHGGILAPIAVVLLFSYCYRRFGYINTIDALINVAIILLVFTILYKFQFGFFVRGIRFFLNGAIVFGWLSGLFCLISIYMYKIQRRKNYLIVAIVFAAAVIWTQSKGPLLALFVSSLYLLIPTSNRKRYKFLIGFCGLLIIFIFNIEIIQDAFLSSRFSVFFRLFSGELQNSDDGSIGLRGELFDAAMKNIINTPIFGIGLGEFGLFDFKYPHNQHLEIATELGLPVFGLHLIFVVTCFLLTSPMYRSCILFFVISGSFSGDISYLRFLYSFCLIGIIFRSGGMSGVIILKDAARQA